MELINGSNRKPNKSHVSIMCSALCGDYKNIDGDWTGHGHPGDRMEQVRHNHQNPQGQHYGPQLYSVSPHIADDTRITFSDVRVTEYQRHSDSDSDIEESKKSNKALLKNNCGHHYDNEAKNEARVTITDMNITAGGIDNIVWKSGQFEDKEEGGSGRKDDEDVDGRVRRLTMTNQDLHPEGRRSSAVYFRVPSLMRPSGMRRQSSAGTGTELATAVDSSISHDKVISTQVYSSHDPVLDRHSDCGVDTGVETIDLDDVDEYNPVVSNVTPKVAKQAFYSDSSVSHNATATSSSGGNNNDIDISSLQKDDEVMESGVFTLESSVSTSTSHQALDEKINIPTAVTTANLGYKMVDTNHGSRLSMDTDADSVFLEAQKCEEDIKRLQREIYEIELLEKRERQSNHGGDKDSIQRYESEVEKLRREIAELDKTVVTLNSYAHSQKAEFGHSGNHFQSHRERLDDDIHMSPESKSTSKSGGTLKFLKNPFSKNKNSGYIFSTLTGRTKQSCEGAYNEGISVTGVSKEYHADTDYSSPLVGNDSEICSGEAGSSQKSSGWDEKNSNVLRNHHDNVDGSGYRHYDTRGIVTHRGAGYREKNEQSIEEEWPQVVIHKKSSITGPGKNDKPKRTVTFQKSVSSPTVPTEGSNYFRDVTGCSDVGSEMRPIVIKKSSSLQSETQSSSGRKLKVSSNSRRSSRSNSKSPSPPRRQSGEAIWNSRQRGNSRLKVGKSNSIRLANSQVDDHDAENAHFLKLEKIPFSEK